MPRSCSVHQGQLVFAQLMRHLPLSTFRRCVAHYAGEHKVKSFSCLDQYLCIAFALLTYRESLRDIQACLRAQSSKLYHLGIRGCIARNTLANANATRDWRIYASFAQRLIGLARGLHAHEPFGVDLAETLYALDATTIDLCLSVYPWAPFRSAKAAIKLHTLLDLRGSIPSFIHISDGKLKAERRYSHPVDRARGSRAVFKWIQQHLRIKAFFGTSENAVNTQIWIAVSVYGLVAIVKKRLKLPLTLYETLQILTLTLFEQTPLDQPLSRIVTDLDTTHAHNQMNLFE
jgi:hypothetical protein